MILSQGLRWLLLAKHPPSRKMPGPKLTALMAALFVAVIVSFIDRIEREEIIKDERLHVVERLSAARARLEAAINMPMSIARAIAMVYAAHPNMPQDEFPNLAAQAKIVSPNIIDIALFRGTTISNMYPLDGNEKLIGLDFRKVPAHWPTYQDMMTTQQPVITGPLKLLERDGSMAVVARIPVYRNESGSADKHFIGAVGMPFRFGGLLLEAGMPEIEQLLHIAMRGRDGKGSDGEVFYGDPRVFAMNPVLQKVTLHGGGWEIAAYPRSGWGAASQTLYITRLLGLACGLLAAFFAYGLVRHLQQRTENEKRLMESEARLRLRDSALNIAAHAIVITDRDGRIVWANHAFTKLTGYEFEEATEKCGGELVKSGHQDRKFYEEMWQTILSGKVWHGELINRRKDGTLYHEEMCITPICGEDDEITHFVALKQDVTARKIGEEQMKNMAFYDPLTQLPNRRLLLERLKQNLAFSKRNGRYGALMFLDLDNFKPLNDEHGHDIGDLLLIEAAQRISNCVREEDTVARFGGDEFVVILKELNADKTTSAAQASGVAEKIRTALAEPYRLESSHTEGVRSVIEHCCTSSIGIILFINHESSEEDILKWADVAMYQAKMAGRNVVRFYHSG